MNRAQILAEIDRLQPWFHRIDLGDELFTKTESVMGEPVDHPLSVWQTIGKCLPRDLTGKSVLDVGCNAGFYAIEAKRRGAERVLGVDGQRQHIRQAVFVRDLLGLDIDYRRMNVYELTRRSIGQFDITLALGLIYHLKHLVLALENLHEVTRELLIVETAIMPEDEAPPPIQHRLGRLHPLAYIENPVEAKEQVANWFLPSVSALVALLRNTGFDENEIIEIKDERAVIVCRKTAAKEKKDVRHHYLASLALVDGPTKCRINEEISFAVRVANVGLETWPCQKPERARGPSRETLDQRRNLEDHERDERGLIHLASHLLRANESEVEWDYARAKLPHDLKPGESAEIQIIVRAPVEPGAYIVEFDIVAEHIAWFEDFGSGTLRHELTVT